MKEDYRLQNTVIYDPNCQECPRLVDYLSESKQKYPDYHCKPVAPFGDSEARLLIVGLAPGLHGANASGRPFTGDYAGVLLYDTLYRHGFGSAPESRHARDGLILKNCRITNAVKCVPPQNKPDNAEIRQCNPFLAAELNTLPAASVIIALGTIAHRAVLMALNLRPFSAYPFAHEAEHTLNDDLVMVDSYHCSRYNTNTGRLTEDMFDKVFVRARQLLEH